MIAHIQQVVMLEYRLQKENERKAARSQGAGNGYNLTSTEVRRVAPPAGLAARVRKSFVPANASC